MSNPNKGNVHIYGVGGFGTNMAYRFNKLAAEPGQANVRVSYLDTSRSNMKADIDPAAFYCPEDMDGGGKLRGDTTDAFVPVVRSFLHDHPPGEFNIVIFSASGGSGSVGGPLVLKELLNRGIPAMAVVVGSTESNLTATNTLKTLKTLERISLDTKMPVVMHYSQNTADTPRSDTDHAIYRLVTTLTILNSRENDELDTRDIRNWVQYHHTTTVRPGVSLLEVYESTAAAEAGHKTPIAIASLYKSPDELPIKVFPEYHTAGYPKQAIKNFEVLHFVIDYAELGLIAKSLNDRIAELDRQRASRIQSSSLLAASDTVTDDGLII